jgi:hypothetical protein
MHCATLRSGSAQQALCWLASAYCVLRAACLPSAHACPLRMLALCACLPSARRPRAALRPPLRCSCAILSGCLWPLALARVEWEWGRCIINNGVMVMASWALARGADWLELVVRYWSCVRCEHAHARSMDHTNTRAFFIKQKYVWS